MPITSALITAGLRRASGCTHSGSRCTATQIGQYPRSVPWSSSTATTWAFPKSAITSRRP